MSKKKNRELRGIVDLQPFDAYVTWETLCTQSPFHQVHSIPRVVKKTVTDTWIGYNRVPLYK